MPLPLPLLFAASIRMVSLPLLKCLWLSLVDQVNPVRTATQGSSIKASCAYTSFRYGRGYTGHRLLSLADVLFVDQYSHGYSEEIFMAPQSTYSDATQGSFQHDVHGRRVVPGPQPTTHSKTVSPSPQRDCSRPSCRSGVIHFISRYRDTTDFCIGGKRVSLRDGTSVVTNADPSDLPYLELFLLEQYVSYVEAYIASKMETGRPSRLKPFAYEFPLKTA